MGKFQQHQREQLKDQCLKYLGGKKCKHCENIYLPSNAYDFHHFKGLKEQNISQLISKKSKLDLELKKELDKCMILCSNCHRMVTSGLIRIH